MSPTLFSLAQLVQKDTCIELQSSSSSSSSSSRALQWFMTLPLSRQKWDSSDTMCLRALGLVLHVLSLALGL